MAASKEQKKLQSELNQLQKDGNVTQREYKTILNEINKLQSGQTTTLAAIIAKHNQLNKTLKETDKLSQSIRDNEYELINITSTLQGKLKGNLKDFAGIAKRTADVSRNLMKSYNAQLKSGALTKEMHTELAGAATDARKLAKSLETIAMSPLGAVFDEARSSAVDTADAVASIFDSIPGGGYLFKALGGDKLEGQLINATANGFASMAKSLDTGKGKLQALRAGMQAFNATVLLNPMTLVLGAIAAVTVAVVGLVSLFRKVSQSAHEVAEATGLTYAQSKLLVKQSMTQVSSLDNQLSLQKDILAVATETASEFGTMAMLSSEQTHNISEIGLAFGYGAKQAAQVNNQFLRMGMNANDAADAQRNVAAEAVKAGVNVGMVTKDIADNAADMAKFFGSNVKALTKAALQAAKLGISLKTMADVSEGLLKFEDSISAQFEFQALTGRQINLDAARELALRGDIAGATKEVLGAVGSIADFDNMSFLARKKLAEATGMSVDELQKSLIVQSKLKNLNEEDLATMNALGLSASELKNMSAEQIQQKIAEKQANEKMTASFESMKAIVAGALLPAAEALMGAFAAISPILKVIGHIAAAILAPITLLGSIINGTTDDLSTMQVVLGSIGGAMALIYGYANRYNIATKLGLITEKQKTLGMQRQSMIQKGNLAQANQMNLTKNQTLLTQLKINAQKTTALLREKASNALARIRNMFENKNLLTLISQNVQKGIAFVRDQASNALAGARVLIDTVLLGLSAAKAVAEQSTLGALIAQAGATVKNIAKAGIELGIRVAVAAANLAAAAAATLGVGVPAILGATAVGLAAIGGLIYAMTADDLMSPGKGTPGYGSRTLTGPEGTIALNNKDTVIAGTNLFADDMTSSPTAPSSPILSVPTSPTTSNETTSPVNDAAQLASDAIVSKLEEVRQALFNLDIRMDGKVVAETIRTTDSYRRR